MILPTRIYFAAVEWPGLGLGSANDIRTDIDALADDIAELAKDGGPDWQAFCADTVTGDFADITGDVQGILNSRMMGRAA